YRFVVAVNPPEASSEGVQVLVSGEAISPESVREVDGQIWLTFLVGDQKAGAVVPLEIAYTGANTITLLVQRDEGDPAPVPAASLSPFDERAYLKLWKALTLVRGLRLNTNELEYLVSKDVILDQLPLDATEDELL